MGEEHKLSLGGMVLNIRHFPGGFYKKNLSYIRRIPKSIKPTYAEELLPSFLSKRLNNIVGISLEHLLSLSVDCLYHLRISNLNNLSLGFLLGNVSRNSSKVPQISSRQITVLVPVYLLVLPFHLVTLILELGRQHL
jgi:hypothetical protein